MTLSYFLMAAFKFALRPSRVSHSLHENRPKYYVEMLKGISGYVVVVEVMPINVPQS